MSRRKNVLKKVKQMKKQKKHIRNAARMATGITGNNPKRSNNMDNEGKSNGGGVTIIDKFTGEVRQGGPELFKEMFTNLAKEREAFLSSKNPCYLIGRVRQNEKAFDAGEVKRMVDATFECACQDSPDAWYPNQYALSLAFLPLKDIPPQVALFLCNFELGLRISSERAVRHIGKSKRSDESERLASRLDDIGRENDLNSDDYRDIAAHVAGHPRFADATAWYEKRSGKRMQGGHDAGNGNRSMSEAQAHALLLAAGKVLLEVGRDEVERMDLSKPLRKLRGLALDSATVVEQKGRLALVFSGWESDPRELWEIDKVRDYFAALDREFPYWLWFLMPGQVQLSLLLLCRSERVSTDGHETLCSIAPPEMVSWQARQIDALAELGARHGLDEAEVAEVIRNFDRTIQTA